MADKTKVKMNVSIAGERWSFQPGQVVMLDKELAEQWVKSGHAERTSAPLTEGRDLLGDLSAAEAMTHRCEHCSRRARYVFRNRPFCPQHFKAEVGS